MKKWVTILAFLCCAKCIYNSQSQAQTGDEASDETAAVFDQLDSETATPEQLVAPWWQDYIRRPQRRNTDRTVDSGITELLFLTMQHSNTISIAQDTPIIRRTGIAQADSDFDWVQYLSSAWNDTSVPVSTNLQAGGTATRLNDQTANINGGIRRRLRNGGQLDVNQRFGWQDNNSVFFTPGRQAASQFTVSYTHPLLRGSDPSYNNSLIVLAQLDTQAAEADYRSVLQNELLEVVRGYWSLYVERATAIQLARLYVKTRKIVGTLEARQAIDAQRTQYILAKAAMESQKSDLIRARTAVANSETRLRGMINAPALGTSADVEMIPVNHPSLQAYPAEVSTEVQTALQNRPEARSAIAQVKAGATQLGVAQHEMLPALNLITSAYVNGLQGDSRFGQAFGDQFRRGRPSYTIGLQYEFPVGNRRSTAQLSRRQVELRQLQKQYKQALDTIQTEVEIAVRELKTSYQEIGARQRALEAAEAEATTIEVRWKGQIDGNGTSSLNLESLLRAQERVAEAEGGLTLSLVSYNLAMINLKRQTGTLLTENDAVVNDAAVYQPIPEQSIFEQSMMDNPYPEPVTPPAFNGESMQSFELKPLADPIVP